MSIPGSEPDSVCLNCGASLAADYCSGCGQRRTGRLNTRTILGEAIDNLLGFDSRLWRTIRGLTRNPGRVAREYIDGKRATYVGPFRYCVIVLALFFLTSAMVGYDPLDSAGMQVRIDTDDASDQARVVAAVRDFLGRHLMTIFLAAMPALGLALRLLFRRSGRNYAETMALVFFTIGHAYLLSSLLTPLILAWEGGARALRLGFVLAYLTAGAAGFFGGSRWAAVGKTVLGYIAYILAVIVISIAVTLLFMFLTDPG